MVFFLAQFPVLTDTAVVSGTVWTIGGIVIMDRLVSIWSNIKRGSTATMSKEEVEERLAVQDKEMARLGAEIREVDGARSRDVRMICDQLRGMDKSISAAMNDISRAMGRVEGGQEIARAIKDGLEQLARNNTSTPK